MIPRPRFPRVSRSTLVLVLAVAALAFPLGVLATHQFPDVPTGASYHDDVEALVEAGITTGCGGGNYCPTAAVTRGSMAQFLNRLGSLDGTTEPSVNAATAVNANSVDGWSANQLTRAAFNSSASLINGDVAASGSLTASITAPAPGWLLIDSHAAIFNETLSGTDDVHCGLEVDNAAVAGSGVWIDTDYDANVTIDEQECNPAGGHGVCGGTHSVELAIGDLGVDSNILDATLTVQYVPFNGVGDPYPIFGCLIIGAPFGESPAHTNAK
jgi:hypothetical protein